MMTRRECVERIASAIEPLYGEREARQIARMVVAERGGVSEMALLIEPDLAIEIPNLEALVEELAAGRPVQYVLGRSEFCGLAFCVREGCLIPRPETEELVAHILRRCPAARRLLDVGTGSGCIALALKHGLPQAEVVAVDRSPQALQIARENGLRLGLDVRFLEADAFALTETLSSPFDLIVSNPPYIPWQEMPQMRINVTNYEPHEALFVPDADPLCFYRAIARAAQTLLAEEGSLWFEIHESFAEEMLSLLREEGFACTELLYDINDKPRMTWSRRR